MLGAPLRDACRDDSVLSVRGGNYGTRWPRRLSPPDRKGNCASAIGIACCCSALAPNVSAVHYFCRCWKSAFHSLEQVPDGHSTCRSPASRCVGSALPISGRTTVFHVSRVSLVPFKSHAATWFPGSKRVEHPMLSAQKKTM